MNCKIRLIKILLYFNFLLIQVGAFSQEDSSKSIELDEVFVTSFRSEASEENSMHTIALNTDSLSKSGALTLADIIAKQQGVNLLTTGPAISKPVIRGSSGNRVLVLLSELKFDNQQWQEEHGLGLSTMGTDRVELIIGPAGILYGSEAIGGVINIIEELPPEIGTKLLDIRFQSHSNTFGNSIQGGYKTNNGKSWWRLRTNMDNYADYSDGNKNRVLNSRFKGYGIKTSWGFNNNKWRSVNHFMSTYNQFGFIYNDVYSFIKTDERWSRTLINNPSHIVFLNILSSENTIILSPLSKIKFNYGFQTNQRLENEGGNNISLNMLLLTGQYNLKWSRQINDKNHLVISNFIVQEQNTNLGARKIIPNAILHEGNISMYFESRLNKSFILEYGIGGGEKLIVTRLTPSLNDEKKIIHPFNKFSPYYTIYSGLTWYERKHFNLKFNVANGVRIPNLAELSSNGLHEGTFVYEVGNPSLKNEQLYSSNLYLNYTSKNNINVILSPFYNHYKNFVYLNPGNEFDKWYGFPKAYYVQKDVNQYGVEFNIITSLFTTYSISLKGSGMRSITDKGEFTPYTPAIKLTPSINGIIKTTILPVGFFISSDFVLAQNETSTYEPGAQSYQLLNAGISFSLKQEKKQWYFNIIGANILNQAYIDNLSRFKYFGLLNMGRSITISIRYLFN